LVLRIHGTSTLVSTPKEIIQIKLDILKGDYI